MAYNQIPAKFLLPPPRTYLTPEHFSKGGNTGISSPPHHCIITALARPAFQLSSPGKSLKVFPQLLPGAAGRVKSGNEDATQDETLSQSLAFFTFPVVCETRRLAEVIHFRQFSSRGFWLPRAGESRLDEHLFLFGRRAQGLGDRWLWVQILTLSPCQLCDLRQGCHPL